MINTTLCGTDELGREVYATDNNGNRTWHLADGTPWPDEQVDRA